MKDVLLVLQVWDLEKISPRLILRLLPSLKYSPNEHTVSLSAMDLKPVLPMHVQKITKSNFETEYLGRVGVW